MPKNPQQISPLDHYGGELIEAPLEFFASVMLLTEKHGFHWPLRANLDIFGLFCWWKYESRRLSLRKGSRNDYIDRIHVLAKKLTDVLDTAGLRLPRVIEMNSSTLGEHLNFAETKASLQALTNATEKLIKSRDKKAPVNQQRKADRKILINKLYRIFRRGTGKTQKYTFHPTEEIFSGDFFNFLRDCYEIIGLGYKSDSGIAKDIERYLHKTP